MKIAFENINVKMYLYAHILGQSDLLFFSKDIEQYDNFTV